MHIKNPPPWKSYTVTKTNYQGVDCCKTHNECINAHKKSTTLEIIYSDQNQLPRGGHYHDFQFEQ
ncbi:hypothetical protein DV714_01475 [Parageobacillus thermoglucosidasius]|nr:hypothetical protein DV714_01475 [Parageobacillus thermoglucosidasius]